MADNPISSWPSNYGKEQTSIDDLAEQLGVITQYIAGGNQGLSGKVPKKPTDIARAFIGESLEDRQETRKALPTIFQSYLNRIATGSMDPDEAGYSYLDLVRSTGGNLKEGYKKSEKLSKSTMGFAPAEKYERYKPAASLAYEQLLGRSISDTEFKNYVSAAQGLGISKGPDFQQFMGKVLLSSPEYKSQAVIFDPAQLATAIKTFKDTL